MRPKTIAPTSHTLLMGGGAKALAPSPMCYEWEMWGLKYLPFKCFKLSFTPKISKLLFAAYSRAPNENPLPQEVFFPNANQ